MKIAKLVLAIAFLSLAGASEGQILKQRKPGLWEIQYTVESAQATAEYAGMAERLKNMPPEKRAQMEAYMKERGMGAQLGPGGLPTMTMRVCLTPQDLAEESSHAFLQTLRERGDCTSKILAESSSEVHLEAHCRAPDSKTDVDARIFNVAPEHYSVDLKSTGPRGDMHMQQRARWLGADCKQMH